MFIPFVGSIAGLTAGALTTRDHDRGGTAPGGDPGALLDFRDGDWRLGPPTPYATLLQAERKLRPALGLTLLRARF